VSHAHPTNGSNELCDKQLVGLQLAIAVCLVQ